VNLTPLAPPPASLTKEVSGPEGPLGEAQTISYMNVGDGDKDEKGKREVTTKNERGGKRLAKKSGKE